jgi:phage portal protein BeeE
MVYEKSVLDKWTEYSVLKSAEEKGIEKKNFEVVENLLSANRFTVAEIANFAGVTESFVKKVQSKYYKKR